MNRREVGRAHNDRASPPLGFARADEVEARVLEELA